MSPPLTIAHFGYGYWGPNLVRNFTNLQDCRIKWLIDADKCNLEKAQSKHPSILCSDDPEDALLDREVLAVVIATPAETHFDLAKKAIKLGKHVFMEKPLCDNLSDAIELEKLARKHNRILFIGHVFIYNNAVQEIKKRIDKGELGNIYCIHSQRLNLGRVRTDVDVLWNLAPHDISILLYLLGESPKTVQGYGHSILQPKINDIGFIDLTFPSGTAAHIHCSWLHPKKTREMVIVGSKKMLVYNDVSEKEKISIYDCGIDKKAPPRSSTPFESFARFQLLKRIGDITIPDIPFPEPLSEQAKAFIECIKTGKPAITDGKMGVEVVRILEAASPRD